MILYVYHTYSHFSVFCQAFTRVVPAEGDDFRFLYIPLVFPMLRIWRVVMDLLQISNDTIPFAIKVLAVSNSTCSFNILMYIRT